MTQASFLAIGTMGTTSPVIRGSLVKEILLNDPPPPPPPNVPELITSSAEPLPSVKDLVELHQQKAQCASCHARFDFIGLGLENFDAIGMWREKELVTNVEYFYQLKNPKAKERFILSMPAGTSQWRKVQRCPRTESRTHETGKTGGRFPV